MAVPQTANAKTYEVNSANAGGATTVTLAKPAFKVYVQNMSTTTTDSVDIQFNGISGKWRIFGTGGSTSIITTPDGFIVTSVTTTAVSGTPLTQIIAWELSTT